MAKISITNIGVKRFEFKNNFLEQKEFIFEPKLKKSISQIDENHYMVALKMDVKHSEEKPFPFDLYCEVLGSFCISEEESEKEIYEFLNKQGVQTLFPYLRSLIMTLTVNSFVSPLVLPIIDVSKDFEEESDNI